MENNYTRFKKDDWDFLIVLDACRFDFFAHLYKYFFDGNLSKIYSLGSHTREWSKNTFRDYYEDIVYISSTPNINSLISILGFDARKHFYKVVDVWRFGWNEKLGTVHPRTVNYVTLSLKDKYPNKRFILHYLQPHAPYISKKFFSSDKKYKLYYLAPIRARSALNPRRERILRILKGNCLYSLARASIYYYKLRECLHLPPTSPIDATRRKFGINGLRQAYAENLKIVLSYITSLVPKLSGNVVITSDHGELLGENRMFAHIYGYHHPILRYVPWFKVTSVKNISIARVFNYTERTCES